MSINEINKRKHTSTEQPDNMEESIEEPQAKMFKNDTYIEANLEIIDNEKIEENNVSSAMICSQIDINTKHNFHSETVNNNMNVETTNLSCVTENDTEVEVIDPVITDKNTEPAVLENIENLTKLEGLQTVDLNETEEKKETLVESPIELDESVQILKDKTLETIILDDTLEEEIVTIATTTEDTENNVASITIDTTEIINSDDDNTQEIPSEFIEEKLKAQSNKTDVDDIGKPDISISFKDDFTANTYKLEIISFLNKFSELQLNCIDGVTLTWNRKVSCDAETPKLDTQIDATKNQSKTKRQKKSKTQKELFVVDATPSKNENPNLRYASKFVVEPESEQKQEKKIECFNCKGNHRVANCPKSDGKTKPKSNLQKSMRYHVEENDKFKKFVPGKISDELRRAMGLRNQEYPTYIYLMRLYGYPPGWLEEAKNSDGVLDMFDINGRNLSNCSDPKRRLDREKIINYPGFNVPPEKGMRDEHRLYEVPCYSKPYHKDVFIRYYDNLLASQQDNHETCDMEIDNENEEKSIQEVHPVEDPALKELEKRKNELLAELNQEEIIEIEDDEDTTAETNDNLNEELTETKLNRSLTVCYGTPILSTSTPYTNLPNTESFSKDISPIILFENLPNSTGKYEQMSDVLSKVRTTLKKLHDDK